MLKEALDQLQGNEEGKRYLTRMIEKRTIPHALLFSGPDSVDKGKIAHAFATDVLACDGSTSEMTNHPDLRVYHPEGKIGMHSMETIRQFCQEVYYPPYQSEKKLFILYDAERMLSYSANALLKTLEEPAPHSIIILLSHAPELLLPTIRSRCFQVAFASSTTATANPWQEKAAAILSKGKIGNYTQLIAVAAEIGQQMEQQQEQLEETVRTSLTASYPEGMSSVQKQAIEKEVEGALAMQMAENVHAFFGQILAWYRDLHLLRVNGNRDYLFHPKSQEALDQTLQRGELLPLEHVQKVIAHAQLSFARSTPITHCLEALFLQLNLI